MKDLDYQELSKMSKDEILSFYKTREDGLTTKEVRKRLEEYGENIPKENDKKGILYFILESFKDKFILILIVLSVINYFTGDTIGSIIILVITVISALISFIIVIFLPLIYYLITAYLRRISLDKGDKEKLYKFSKFLSLI